MVFIPGAVSRRLVAGALPDNNLPVLSCSSTRANIKGQQMARRHRAQQREQQISSHQLPSDAESECSTSTATGMFQGGMFPLVAVSLAITYLHLHPFLQWEGNFGHTAVFTNSL